MLILTQPEKIVRDAPVAQNVVWEHLLSSNQQCHGASLACTEPEPTTSSPVRSTYRSLRKAEDAERVQAIIDERAAQMAKPQTWLEQALDEGVREDREFDEYIRRNKALLVDVDSTIPEMDDPWFVRWLKRDDARTSAVRRSARRRFAKLEADGSSDGTEDTCSELSASTNDTTSTNPTHAPSDSSDSSTSQDPAPSDCSDSSSSRENTEALEHPPHDQFFFQRHDLRCGVYAINNIVGWGVLTRSEADAGAELAARAWRERVSKHRSGDGDYSLAALGEAVHACSSFRLDFVKYSHRIAAGIVTHPGDPVEAGGTVLGYLIHRANHWVALVLTRDVVYDRRTKAKAWLYDSLADGPVPLSDQQLAEYLGRKAFQLYSI